MKIAIAGDSAGEVLASLLADYLAERYQVVLISSNDNKPNEFYAELSDRVASAVIEGRYERAILVCGTGIGVCISANKVHGIRAALCHDTYSAERAVLSNNAQIITMGSRVVGVEVAKTIADAFLVQYFDSQGRSASNVEAIDCIDDKYRV